MNIVLIITDQQPKWTIGAYGGDFDTPYLDRLAEQGIRFDRAYTASPVCTAARGSLFTGLYPQCNGAWANCMTVHRNIPMMGSIFRDAGYRAGYTGKWHLDGGGYDGKGEADGGFEADWWFDRINLLNELPQSIRDCYSSNATADQLREAGFSDEHTYCTRVCDHAVDFLEKVGDEPFILIVSIDEPHSPWTVPADWWDRQDVSAIPERPNYCPDMTGKPELQQIYARELAMDHDNPTWQQLMAKRIRQFTSNNYADRQIGRVIDAIDAQHADDTAIIYTSDHGDQLGSHGLHDKGPWMYEESTNPGFIVRTPDGPRGEVSDALVSHLDILPTMLELTGVQHPSDGQALHGQSIAPVLADPTASVREDLLISFNRFQIGANDEARGGYWPIRCITDGRHKLAINLLDRDELYDLQEDPYELTNCIDDSAYAAVRDHLHDRVLEVMRDSRDPMWNFYYRDRPWRKGPHHYMPTHLSPLLQQPESQ